MRLTAQQLRLKRWLSALGIAKVMFEEDGYHTVYLEEIELFIKEAENGRNDTSPGRRQGGQGGA
jgi:hypothetical protein